MIQHFIALLAWFSFFSIIEHLGEKELAASHIIRSIYMVLIIPVFGLGDTVNSLTGNLLGLQKPKLVITLLKKSLALGLVYCLILQPIIFLFPRKMILPFTLDEELIAMAIPSMRVVFTALFLFTVIIVGFRIISGAGKTWIGLGIEFLTIVVYLVSAWYLAHIPNVELWVVWTSEFIYFGIFLILVYWYLWKGKWRESQV
jgi:Na+-driven multidrug efflux pump